MQGERHPARLAVAEAREQVLEQLSDAFAKDELGLDEFEARVDGAYQATTEVGLHALVKDLAAPVAAPEPRATAGQGAQTALAVVGTRAPRVLAILASFAELNRMPAEGAATGPVLRIVGSAVLGNVEVRTLPRGVSASQVQLRALPPKRGRGEES